MLAGDISRKSSSGSGPDGGSISQAADKTHSPDPDSRNQTRRERTVPGRQADHHEIVKSMQKRGQCESRQCGAWQAIALDARLGTPVSPNRRKHYLHEGRCQTSRKSLRTLNILDIEKILVRCKAEDHERRVDYAVERFVEVVEADAHEPERAGT